MASNFISLPGYHLTEEIYNGSRTLVYRGYRETDSSPVAIKLLKNPYPSFNELMQFRNQYTIAKNLNSPLIIQTYSLDAYQNSYALVMEDFGGISLKKWKVAGKVESLREFLFIAIALCNTLDILDGERIIHKDIKPSNILINPETKQVKLIDFSIASLLPRETQTLINPNVLEGTLAYISPEQTGRMNRGIDYRTDFYSLGVTFYELLTGELPFQSNEPMELVHCHIAKLPPLIHEINSQIPPLLSKIVSKLMAKNAEDRYQSALGLKFDLENCLHQLEETGEIQSFEIGRWDVCVGVARRRHRFTIPDKLYGRETEISILLQAFERVSLGASEMMLVAGFSGIGKTAVINEVHKPIVRQRGYFIKGKYDQFQRNIPLAGFLQAFRDLIRQLLTLNDAQIQQWKSKILEAIGENGQVIVEVIPELSKIIGQQPPVTELSGTAAQNRFNLLFQNFTRVFSSFEHPLVIFLDDLQWADSASLKLMQLLMADTGHLLLIGAYRDREVNPVHPLILTRNEIEKAQVVVNTITLAPLSQEQLNQLVADTLASDVNIAFPLSKLVYQKTQGNPFFSKQFIKTLHEDGLIEFNFAVGCWQCDITQINQQALTDDVVELIVLQLQKLPESTQFVLQLAACIGNQFDLKTLAIVGEKSELETADCLWKGLEEGLVIPQSEVYKFYQQESLVMSHKSLENSLQMANEQGQMTVTYKFLHDRVQQAAYSLIPEEEKQRTHLKIGQLLLNNITAAEQEENLFEIVNQLNIGKSLIVEPGLQIELAKLNLKAGQKARAATAYSAAYEYCSTGIALLHIGNKESCWQTQYKLTLELYELATETAYLSGNFQQMEQWADIVLQQAKTSIDKMKVYAVKIQADMAQVKKLEALKIGLEALELLGVSLPELLEPLDIEQALTETAAILDGKNIQELINLPLITDIQKLAAARILTSIAPAAYQAAPLMFGLVICKLVNLSINYGNSLFSSYAYACYGILLKEVFQDIESAYEFGRLALNLAERFNAPDAKGSALVVVAGSTMYGKVHVRETLPIFWDSYQSALESGNFEFVGYAAVMKCQYSYLIGEELTVLEREMATISDVLARFKQENILSVQQILHLSVLKLLNPWKSVYIYQDQISHGKDILHLLNKTNDRTGIFQFYFNKLIIVCLFGKEKKAQINALKAEKYLDGVQGNLFVPLFHFYDSLAHLGIYPSLADSQQQHLLNRVANNQQKMKLWADHAPMNFLHKFHLVEAEKERVLGNKAKAIDLYDKGIAGAKENGYIQEEAFANELAAKFYLDWRKERIAQDYITQAYYCYTRWGAKAKVADLEKRYPELLAPILQQTRSAFSTNETIFALESVSASSSNSSSVSVALDLAAILKASQTISSEIELEKLLSSLLSIVIKNAGADKCVLMLVESGKLVVRALAKPGLENNGNTKVDFSPMLINPQPVEESIDIPLSLINTVKRNLEPAVIVDATAHLQLISDPYIEQQQPKSILCSPILHQGKLLGILYLENNLATGAFTHQRVELLSLLCTQAAISLENAQLYQRTREYAQQLEQSFAELSTSNSRFEKLVDNVPGVVYQYRISRDGSISMPYISKDCYELYEITAEQAISNVQLLLDRIHPDDATSHQQSIANSTQTLTPWQWSGRIITASGIVKWIHGEARLEQDVDGTLVWDGLIFDITERKRIEAERQQKSLELETALQDLQQAQLQMVQSEKMSALGNLVAGVAHEMNNPLGFISASLKQAKPIFADVVEHLKLYQENFPVSVDEIKDHADEIDLDFSLEDLPKMIDSMTMACDRIKNISTSLRTFSRADQAYKVRFNIHEGIDSTILILKHRLKANESHPAIEVVTNYGKLPQIECFPGQLNQVFMNIIANAIDALDESNTGLSFEEIKANPNRIIITTSLKDKQVEVKIADNGVGMSESLKQKVFDHLFTTKAVGQGTGLGLAIAKSIVVEKHSGNLDVNSTLGKGTEFVITLPIMAEIDPVISSKIDSY